MSFGSGSNCPQASQTCCDSITSHFCKTVRFQIMIKSVYYIISIFYGWSSTTGKIKLEQVDFLPLYGLLVSIYIWACETRLAGPEEEFVQLTVILALQDQCQSARWKEEVAEEVDFRRTHSWNLPPMLYHFHKSDPDVRRVAGDCHSFWRMTAKVWKIDEDISVRRYHWKFQQTFIVRRRWKVDCLKFSQNNKFVLNWSNFCTKLYFCVSLAIYCCRRYEL